MTLPALPRPFPRLFQIGVKPVGPEAWIDADKQLAAYLEEKRRLFASQHEAVFAATPDTETAQAEVRDRLARHLPDRFPDIYRREAGAMLILPAQLSVPLDAPDVPPLQTAALLVQEDLVLMRRGADGWYLAAGALCFPSSWRLADKAGRRIDEVHAPVPGFGTGTRGAELIGRMFDSMQPGTWALRWNWSLYGDDALHHPHDSPPRRFGAGDRADPVFLRLERQTLTKLPESGDILFTVRIYVDPLPALARQPDAREVAAALYEQLDALDEAQLAYKGMTLEIGRVLRRLKEIAG